MKLNKSAQTLLDRYLLAVRRALVGKEREDICKEIESYLLDHLEERNPKADEISETQVLDLLQELGSPAKLAAQFGPQRHLIGPRLFPVYLLVLRIVVPVVLGALALSLLIRVATDEFASGALPALELLGTLWNGAFMAAAFVTLVFATLERTSAEKALKELEDFEKFDPSDLPELDEKENKFSMAETVAEIVFGILGLAFFTYLYHSGGRLPVFNQMAGGLAQARLLTDSSIRFLPFMIALNGLEVSRAAVLLMQNRRTTLTNWWHVCAQLANLVLVVLLLRAFPLISMADLQFLPFAADWDVARMEAGVNTGLRVVMVLAAWGILIKFGKIIYRQFTPTPV